jgi:predicted phage terminase large subunit-like protein
LQTKKIKLTPKLIEGFQKAYLHSQFDNPAPTPEFHREIWEDFCGDHRFVAHAAPRGHAKSTGVAHTCTLALVLFRIRDFGVIVSDTEGQASKFLKDIATELEENEDIKRDFAIKGFIKNTETEIEVEFLDGERFCIIAKGSEQKVRGLKWRNKRPNFVVGDDLENDEIVLNPQRRNKFKEWFLNALLPCGSKNCIFRIVGTILHFDSLLQNLLEDKEWMSRKFKAHAAFDDFTDLLWPDNYDEQHYRSVRQKFINQGKPEGYSQEYLNEPFSEQASFFRRADLVDYKPSDYDADKTFYCAVDLAVSQKETADRTVFMVAGVNTHGMVFIEDVVKGRFDPLEVIDIFFQIVDKYSPAMFFVESGAIQKSIGPFLNEEQVKRNKFLSMKLVTPAKDKQTRARSIAGRMKAGGVKFDKNSDWYPELEQELLQFPRGKHDDQVDALAYLGLELNELITPQTEEEQEEEYWQRIQREDNQNRNRVTGY